MNQDEAGIFVDPGPIDASILTKQSSHRSENIWNGQELPKLRFRRGTNLPEKLDFRIEEKLISVGFYGLYKLGHIKHDWCLIEALIERWRPETHTFHLPVGEMTITLQDVAMICGLPIDGHPVIGKETHKKLGEWKELCIELLGFEPSDGDIDGGFIKFKSVLNYFGEDSFKNLPPNASGEMVTMYARAYIFLRLGSFALADQNDTKVKLIYLPLLRNFNAIGEYSWGSAVLAFLYRELCQATNPTSHGCSGFLTLVQVCQLYLITLSSVLKCWFLQDAKFFVFCYVLLIFLNRFGRGKDCCVHNLLGRGMIYSSKMGHCHTVAGI